jgi:hypothetical protein
MTTLTTTLIVDDVVIERESPEATELYVKLMREAREKLLEARGVLAWTPDAVAHVWRKQHTKVEHEIDKLITPAALFSADLRRSGLESAIDDAKFRKHI